MSAQARRSTGLALRCQRLGAGCLYPPLGRPSPSPSQFSQRITSRLKPVQLFASTVVSLSASSNCRTALADTLTARSTVLHICPVVRGRIRSPPFTMGSVRQARDQHKHEHDSEHDSASSSHEHSVEIDHDHDHGHDHGHGHGLFGHHHHHDNTFLTSTDKNDPGVRITRIGLLSNLAMAIAKFIGGWAFNSKAMIADAWHSIADLASDILTLATVSWSLKGPTERFPLGFGKVESLGALGVSGMLLVGGFYMGFESAVTLYGHWNPEAAHEMLEHVAHGHSHSHSHSHADLGIPSIHAAWLAGGTILIKEWLYQASTSRSLLPLMHRSFLLTCLLLQP